MYLGIYLPYETVVKVYLAILAVDNDPDYPSVTEILTKVEEGGDLNKCDVRELNDTIMRQFKQIVALYNEERDYPYCIFGGPVVNSTVVVPRVLYRMAVPTQQEIEAVLTAYNESPWRALCGEKTLANVGLFDIEPWTD